MKVKALFKGLLGCALASTMLMGFAGCGGSESNNSDSKTLNLLAWSGIEDEAIQKLEELSGYKINYTSFSSLEEMQTKVMSNSTQYDVAMCSDYIITALVEQGELEEIDTSKISNYSKIGKGYLSPSYDPDNKWSVPYSGGGIGILINRDKTDAKITSYADLWQSDLKDSIAFVDDERMALSICNLVNGNDFNATDEKQIEAAGEKLKELIPNIHAFTSTGHKLILNGEASVIVCATGNEYKAAKEMDNFEFVVPSEGEHMYMDSYVIPKGANMDAAYKFINAVISTEYMTRNGDDTNWGYGYVNTDVEKMAKEAGISDKLLSIAYPDDSAYKNAHYMENIGSASLVYDQVWSEVKLAAGSLMSSAE